MTAVGRGQPHRNALVKPEPITKEEILAHDPHAVCIYGGKKGPIAFVPHRQKSAGSALGAIFKKTIDTSENPKEWMGKVGELNGLLKDDPASVRTITRKEINISVTREKIAADLYKELSEGMFDVPKTRLAELPVIDRFTERDFLAIEWVRRGITNTLRVMSRFVDGYHDFAKARTREDGVDYSFMGYIEKFHRPPDFLLTEEGVPVPLKGLIELLAVGRIVADTDMIGGGGENAGFKWVYDDHGTIIGAQTVKIDPGYAFQFKTAANWLFNKLQNKHAQRLENDRDIQIANNHQGVTIKWESMTLEQRDTFLSALQNCDRYLSDDVLSFLFYREGRFQDSMPKDVAEEMISDFREWIALQFEIFEEKISANPPHQPGTNILSDREPSILPTSQAGVTEHISTDTNQTIETTSFNDDGKAVPKDKEVVNETTTVGPTPTRAAVINEDLETMMRLHGIDPEIIRKAVSNGATPMHFAASKGLLEVMQRLYNKDPDLVYKAAKGGVTPMHCAVESGNLEAVQWLDSKAPEHFHTPDNDGNTPMHNAVRKGQLEVVQWLDSKDPDLVRKTDNSGHTPMYYASYSRKLEVKQWLHDKDPEFFTRPENRVVFVPIERPAGSSVAPAEGLANKEVVEDKVAVVPIEGPPVRPKYTTKVVVVRNRPTLRSEDKVAVVPIEGPPVRPKYTTKVVVVRNRPTLRSEDKVAVVPIEGPANKEVVNETITMGLTPMHAAALSGDLETMQSLYDKDPELIRQVDETGQTPVHSAAKAGNWKAIMWLCKKDPALARQADTSGQTPMHSAAKAGSVQAMQMLFAHGSGLHPVDKEGRTPLHFATLNGHLEAIQWLR